MAQYQQLLMEFISITQEKLLIQQFFYAFYWKLFTQYLWILLGTKIRSLSTGKSSMDILDSQKVFQTLVIFNIGHKKLYTVHTRYYNNYVQDMHSVQLHSDYKDSIFWAW